MNLVFWNIEHLALAKKIEHFWNSMTFIKFKKHRMNKEQSEKRDKLITQLEEHEDHIKKFYPWTTESKSKQIRNLRKKRINEFLTEEIIPWLVESKYFDTYSIPTKKDTLWREKKTYY